MTHIENIPHILQYGITHKNSPKANSNYVSIGDVSLIDTRNTIVVSVDNGDFLNFNAPRITLGDFIPFYFGIRMPMLYVMQNGGNFVANATPAEDIIYVACSICKIIEHGQLFYFSDGHATDKLTSFYDKDMIDKLFQIIDYNAIKAAYWGGQENLDTKRKKQAEFLVYNDLPVDFLSGFGCYNDEAKRRLVQIGINDDIVKVVPNAYF
jgi:hypothetical protein